MLASVLLTAAASGAEQEAPRVTHLLDDNDGRTPLHTVVPEYPRLARRDRVEGEVQVCFNVGRDGRPYRVAVRSSSNRVFERPSIRAVRDSTYRRLEDHEKLPAMKTCRTFRFTLEPVVREGPSSVIDDPD